MSQSAIAIGRPLVKSLIFAVVMSIVLAFVAIELGGFTFYDKAKYQAIFVNSSDLQDGDPVLIGGVRVGKVIELGLHENTESKVGFEVKKNIELDDEVSAAVRYKNLTGDRYLELVPGQGRGRLDEDAVIPVTRTRPALDLDALLGGLQPLFEGLDPTQINQVSTELVSVLQGEGGTLETLLGRVASFSSTLADKDEVIGQVVNNLNTVLGNLDTHSVELSETISNMQKLASGLALDRGALGRSFADVERLVSSTSNLVVDLRDPFQGFVNELGRVSRQANAGAGTINEVLRLLPGAYLRIGRVASRGAAYNMYICSLRVRFTDPAGNAYYTPYIGPSAGVRRCQQGIAPLETPEEREAKAGASGGEGDE